MDSGLRQMAQAELPALLRIWLMLQSMPKEPMSELLTMPFPFLLPTLMLISALKNPHSRILVLLDFVNDSGTTSQIPC
jgi:hypothetical protein